MRCYFSNISLNTSWSSICLTLCAIVTSLSHFSKANCQQSFFGSGFEQSTKQSTEQSANSDTILITIKKADQLELIQTDSGTVQKFYSNNKSNKVVFEHTDWIMYCDSAYLWLEKNTVEAFSNVSIDAKDSVQLLGDYLFYDGLSRKGYLFGNGRLEQNDQVLTTQKLYFDRGNQKAYFLNWGEIRKSEAGSVDEQQSQIIRSKRCFYYLNNEMTFFKDSVSILDKDFNLYTDTLKHDLVSEVSTFLGPTWIVQPSNDKIYCEQGWYNHQSNYAKFGKGTIIYSDKQTIETDDLDYNLKTKKGKINIGFKLYDPVEEIKIESKKAKYFEDRDFLMAYEQAKLTNYEGLSDSTFMLSDTLKYYKIAENGLQYSVINSIDDVRIYNEDYQAVCGYSTYSEQDSIYKLYREPIVWYGEWQLTADTISIKFSGNEIDFFNMKGNAFAISSTTQSYYNQIAGRTMFGRFRDGKLHTIDVNGNAKSIYFAREDNSEALEGVNSSESAKMKVRFVEEELDKISFLVEPNVEYTPFHLFVESKLRLEEFIWMPENKPVLGDFK